MAGQNKALILLIHDQGTQLMSWQLRKLSIVEEYRNTSADHEAFITQIRNYPDYQVLVVTDLIDENFRHDLIVHVSGADREALIKRKLDFTFRNTRYRIGRVKGREPDGRKQDKLLLAAISKPEMLDNWIGLLLDEKRAIQSITSLAWLLRHYLPLQKLDKEPTLLVATIDPGNSLRQSFFMDGKLMFSRLTNLTADTGANLASEVHNETLQVRQYLERIQFVQYEAPLRIQVISTIRAEDLPLEEHSNESNRFEQINVREESSKLGIIANGFALKPAHYLIAKVLAVTAPQNIYAPPSATRYSDLLRVGSYIAVAAGVLLLVGIGGNLPLAMGIKAKWDQRASFEARTAPLLREYEQLSNSFPATEIPATEMALIVQAYDRVRSQVLTPVPVMNMISAAMARTSGLQLTGITWALEEIPFVPAANTKGKARSAPQPFSGITSETALINAVLKQNTRLKITIVGESFSDTSFRLAQQQVVSLVDALGEFPGVTVSASRMPTDVRTDISLSTRVDDGEVRAPFTLELTQTLETATPRVAVQP